MAPLIRLPDPAVLADAPGNAGRGRAGLRARTRTSSPGWGRRSAGRWIAWREARKVVGDDVIRGHPAGWLGLRPGRRRRPRCPAGRRIAPGDHRRCHRTVRRCPDWFEKLVAARWHGDHGGFRRRPPGATACAVADLAGSAVGGSRTRTCGIDPPNPEIGVVHRRTPDADVYLVINTGPTDGTVHGVAAYGSQPVRGVGCRVREVVRAGRPGAGMESRCIPTRAR